MCAFNRRCDAVGQPVDDFPANLRAIALADPVESGQDRVLQFIELDDVLRLAPSAILGGRQMTAGVQEIQVRGIDWVRAAEYFGDGLMLGGGWLGGHSGLPVDLVTLR